MAQTLTEAEKYSTDRMYRTVVDVLTKDDPILGRLPFERIQGNSLKYDQITTRSTASFYDVNGTWSESTPVVSTNNLYLRRLGKDVDLDNFLIDTHADQIDIKGTLLEEGVVSVKEKFLDTFYYGSKGATADVGEFDGLQTLIASTTYNTVHAGSGTGSALSIAKLREAVDLVHGKAGMMVMTKKMRRLLGTYLNSIGSAFPAERDQAGLVVHYWDELPIYTSEHIVDTEDTVSGAYSAKTGGAETTIFILSFGPSKLSGVQGSDSITTKLIGDLETKDAQRYRIKWYCAVKFVDLRSCAKIDGIATGSAVTA